jgi:hypothetical protein
MSASSATAISTPLCLPSWHSGGSHSPLPGSLRQSNPGSPLAHSGSYSSSPTTTYRMSPKLDRSHSKLTRVTPPETVRIWLDNWSVSQGSIYRSRSLNHSSSAAAILPVSPKRTLLFPARCPGPNLLCIPMLEELSGFKAKQGQQGERRK